MKTLCTATLILLLGGATATGQTGANPQETSLMTAASNGDLAQVQQLLGQGINIETRDNLGWTPLIWAAYQGRMDVVTLLVAKGANIGAKGNAGQTALHEAGFMGHTDVLLLLRVLP